MSISGSLQDLPVRYEARPLRERILLLVCLVVVLFFVWDSLVMSSIDLRQKKAQSQSTQLRGELTELAARQQVIEARKDFDPDLENRQQLSQLKTAIDSTLQKLEASVGNLISPQEMAALLKELLVNQQNLKLIRLENRPAEALQINQALAEESFGPVLYRHRLVLEFSGGYLATLEYLKKLEELPRQMVWEELKIETQDYPQARVSLQVYTLSLSKGWIGG